MNRRVRLTARLGRGFGTVYRGGSSWITIGRMVDAIKGWN